jgi:hypothetical protein
MVNGARRKGCKAYLAKRGHKQSKCGCEDCGTPASYRCSCIGVRHGRKEVNTHTSCKGSSPIEEGERENR